MTTTKNTTLDFLFKPANVEASENSFSPLVEGFYSASISDVEIKPNKAGNGSYINFTFDVGNRKVFHIVNISNPNEEAQDIGRQEFKRICELSGIEEIKDLKVLLKKEFDLYLTIDEYNGKENNKVKYINAYGSKVDITLDPKTIRRDAMKAVRNKNVQAGTLDI